MNKPHPLSPTVSPLRQVGLLTAVVLILLLITLLVSALDALGRLGGNVSALRVAMSATPGSPSETNALNAAPASTIPGVQARAMAYAMAAGGRSAEAEAWLVSGLGDSSSAYLTQFQLCRLYWDLGLRDRAVQVCQNSVMSADFWLGEGLRVLEQGDRADALALFEMAAYTNPNMAEGWRRYGEALLDAGRPEEAVGALERVLFLTGRPTADVYRTLAQAYLIVDNLTMARDVLDEALLTYPDQREYYTAMAESFLAEGDTKTADSWYVRMLQRWPYDAEIWSARGEIAQGEGRIGDAVAYYQEAANDSPEGFGHWMVLAAAAAEAKDPTLVSEATRRALRLRPEDASAWLQTGRYLMETDQVEAARDAFERVLVLQPGNLEAVAELTALTPTVVP